MRRLRCKLAVALASLVAIAHMTATEHDVAPWWIRVPLAVAGYWVAYSMVNRSHRDETP